MTAGVDMLKVGETLDERYQVLSQIGEGGMGFVFKVKDTELNRILAVKLLSNELSSDTEWRTRFLREGKSLSRLDHPNILKVFRLGLANDASFMVTEFLSGETVRSLLNRTDTLDWKLACNIAMQVCDAMNYAHGLGVVHRDLKPDNIMLLSGTGEPVVKVLDFGLARLSRQERETATLTQTGALLGSVHYMSPEQCQGKPVDFRADIYSLGCVLYECLAGTPPFEADNPIGIIHKHVSEPVSLLVRKAFGDIQPAEGTINALNAVLSKAMEKVPEARYQSMEEFKRDLVCCLNESPLLHSKISLPRRKASSAILPIMSVVLLLAISALIFWLLTDDGKVSIFTLLHSTKNTSVVCDDVVKQVATLQKEGKVGLADKLALAVMRERRDGMSAANKAQILNAVANAYLSSGLKELARQRAEEAFLAVAPQPRNNIIKVNEKESILKNVLESLRIMRATGARYHFDAHGFSGASRAVYKHRATPVEQAMRRMYHAFVEVNDWILNSEICRLMLEMETPFVEEPGVDLLSKSRFYYRLASVSSIDKDKFLEYGNRSVNLVIQAEMPWRAAMALYVLAGQETPEAFQFMERADSLLRKEDKHWVHDDFTTPVTIVNVVSELWNDWGEYDRTISLCSFWVERLRADNQALLKLIPPYIAALCATGRYKEADDFLNQHIRRLHSNQQIGVAFEFERARANFLYKAHRYKEAAREYESSLQQMQSIKMDHPFKYSLYDDFGPYFDCCSILNDQERFKLSREGFYDVAQEYLGTVSTQPSLSMTHAKVIAEAIRTSSYADVPQLTKKSIDVQGGSWSASTWSDLMTLRTCWLFAKIGEFDEATKYDAQRTRLGQAPRALEPVFIDLLLKRYNKAEEQLKLRIQQDQKVAHWRELQKERLLLAIVYLSKGDKSSATKWYKEALSNTRRHKYGGWDSQLDFVRRCFSCADGNVENATTRTKVLPSAPILEDNLAYENLLLCEIAKNNGHSDQASAYLIKAREELMEILGADHLAVQKLNHRIAKERK